jgi:hypothetical protein
MKEVVSPGFDGHGTMLVQIAWFEDIHKRFAELQPANPGDTIFGAERRRPAPDSYFTLSGLTLNC